MLKTSLARNWADWKITAPASHIVKYEDRVFLDNVYELSEFQGDPDDEKDRLWDMLYRSEHTHVWLFDLHLISLPRYCHDCHLGRGGQEPTKRHNGKVFYHSHC